MDYDNFLEKVEKELQKEITNNTRNRLIVIRSSLKQIISDKNEKTPERTKPNDLYKILDEIELFDIKATKYRFSSIDLFPSSAYIELKDESGFKIGKDYLSTYDLETFTKQLKEKNTIYQNYKSS